MCGQYENIYFDKSWKFLIISSGSSDYINASHVSIKNAPNDYILAQGPKDNTTGDFWTMIWEQGITVIAMVTQLRVRFFYDFLI